MKIGSYKLPSNVILAPMAGITDLPFRLISRDHGAKFCFFEMIDTNSIIYSRKVPDNIKTLKRDTPIAAQLVGPDPEMNLKAAKILVKKLNIKFLDINAACPVKKMLKKKAGAYLIKEPANLYKTIELFASNLKLPITVKLRTGFTEVDHKHIAEVARQCEKHGASAIFIHGRTQAQGYGGEVDLAAIKAVTDAVKIPVIGSGNIFSPEMAKNMMDVTGCDGVLIARGAYGNPWIFKATEYYLKTGKLLKEPSLNQRIAAIKKHLGYIKKYRNMHPKSRLGFMKKVAQWYVKDFKNACNIRRIMNDAADEKSLLGIVNNVSKLKYQAL